MLENAARKSSRQEISLNHPSHRMALWLLEASATCCQSDKEVLEGLSLGWPRGAFLVKITTGDITDMH